MEPLAPGGHQSEICKAPLMIPIVARATGKGSHAPRIGPLTTEAHTQCQWAQCTPEVKPPVTTYAIKRDHPNAHTQCHWAQCTPEDQPPVTTYVANKDKSRSRKGSSPDTQNSTICLWIHLHNSNSTNASLKMHSLVFLIWKQTHKPFSSFQPKFSQNLGPTILSLKPKIFSFKIFPSVLKTTYDTFKTFTTTYSKSSSFTKS